jgi:hypothetical protein
MKLSRTPLALAIALLLPVMASAAADYYLKIEGVKGESRVVRCSDGACVVDQLAPGSYKVLVCDAQGKVIPSEARFEYTVVAPRDRASGMATGKRMHKPMTITKEWGRSAAPTNSIAIDEPGVQVVIGVDAAAVDAAVARIGKSRSNIQNN